MLHRYKITYESSNEIKGEINMMSYVLLVIFGCMKFYIVLCVQKKKTKIKIYYN